MTADERLPDAGFSLVEVLVVLSVVGLLSGLMLIMIGQFRYFVSAERQLNEQMALQKTADHIAHLLERAVKFPLDFEPGSPVKFIEAGNGSVRFLGVARAGSSSVAFSDISISLENVNGVGRVVETLSARRLVRDQSEDAQIELMGDVESISFYFLKPHGLRTGQDRWQTDWQIGDQMPKAARIEISARGKSGTINKAFSIALLAN